MSLSSNFPAIKPSLLLDFANTKQLDPRVTFARATTATYYDGVTTAKAEENLLTYSEQFDNADWSSKSNITITANATAAPDGATTADAIFETATTSSHFVARNVVGVTTVDYVVSVYAKAGNRGFVSVAFDSLQAWFNLSTGAVGTVEAGLSASISNAGSGWYRCSIRRTVAVAATKSLAIYACAADNAVSYAGDNSVAAIYIWGAQLEQRSSVTAYTPTTTQPITNYIPVLMTAAAGVPRFDHNPTTDESLGLLIEEQRTNLLTYSAGFNSWGGSLTFFQNQDIAPDGSNTAAVFRGNGLLGISPGGVSAGTYTFSVYAKAYWSNFVRLNIWNGTTDIGESFNLTTGAAAGGYGTRTTSSTFVGNGWWRLTLTVATSTTTLYCQIHVDNTNTVLVWGAQAEAGAFATSYIPTVASTVTRNADQASMTGTNFSSWFSAGEGTMYAEARSTSLVAAGNGVFGITDGTISNRFGVYAISTNNAVSGYMTTNGTLQADMPVNNAAASGAQFRSAFAYKFNDFAFSANGAAALTDTSGTISVANQAVIGSIYITISNSLNGTIKKIAYYPLRVTNAQLQALTS